MVARIWHGAVPIAKSKTYLDLMRLVAIEDYKSTPGNRGAFVLHRATEDIGHFIMLALWDSRDAIKRFAGEDIEAAKYYEFDRFFLVELEPNVQHYDVFEGA